MPVLLSVLCSLIFYKIVCVSFCDYYKQYATIHNNTQQYATMRNMVSFKSLLNELYL